MSTTVEQPVGTYSDVRQYLDELDRRDLELGRQLRHGVLHLAADPPEGGVDAVRAIKTLVMKADAKHWEPGQSNSVNGESRFLGDSKVTVSADFAGKDGTLVLLDSTSLGGPDHHTPLAQTDTVAKAAKRGAWESLATWQDKAGAIWVFASIVGPVAPDAKFATTNGTATHGSIVAFKVEEKDGRPVLTPSWISRDLRNPAPPAIANGVVFALDGGNSTTHATLYALDAATGKQLYSSGDAIETYTHLAGMSIGDGHVFFTTHDNTLYSFGIPLEH